MHPTAAITGAALPVIPYDWRAARMPVPTSRAASGALLFGSHAPMRARPVVSEPAENFDWRVHSRTPLRAPARDCATPLPARRVSGDNIVRANKRTAHALTRMRRV